MKYIVVFLILNVLLLSSIPGMAHVHYGKTTCCKHIASHDCGKQSKHTSDDDCAKGTCNTMLSCGANGFLVASPISLSPAMVDLSNQITRPFITGELSDYHSNDWNPPKG